MLKRTSKKNIDTILKNNPNWNVLDIGCGYRAHPNAKKIADIQDLSKYYEGREFIKIDGKKLPFKDHEFD